MYCGEIAAAAASAAQWASMRHRILVNRATEVISLPLMLNMMSFSFSPATDEGVPYSTLVMITCLCALIVVAVRCGFISSAIIPI